MANPPNVGNDEKLFARSFSKAALVTGEVPNVGVAPPPSASSNLRLPRAMKPAPKNFTESDEKISVNAALTERPTQSWLSAKTGIPPLGAGQPVRVRIIR